MRYSLIREHENCKSIPFIGSVPIRSGYSINTPEITSLAGALRRHSNRIMALFRQVSRAPRVVLQCQKLATAYQQSHRSYADMPEMSFTFASPSDVC